MALKSMANDHENEGDRRGGYAYKLAIAGAIAVGELILLAFLLEGGPLFKVIFAVVFTILLVAYLRYVYLRWFK